MFFGAILSFPPVVFICMYSSHLSVICYRFRKVLLAHCINCIVDTVLCQGAILSFTPGAILSFPPIVYVVKTSAYYC